MTESWPQPNSPSVDHLANRQPIHLVRTPIPVKQSCWGDCQVCGDRATGKHYGVIACEGCKGFFKRSVRKKLIYTCRAKGSCVIDKLQRNRCQRCRLEKCFKAGMNQDAVQCERKPLITSTLSTPTSHAIVGDRNKCFHSVESSPSEILMPVTPPSSLPDVPSPSYPSQETSSILGPQHSEFRLYIPNLAVPDFSMDYIYEFATRLLFVSVDWCRSISTFRSLRKADQVALLKRSWPEIFLLGVVQLIEKFPFSPLFAFAASDLKKEKGQKHEGYPKCQQSIFNNIMIVKNFVFGFARMELDPMEFAYVKAIVLFNSDPHIPVADPKHIENLQEQTHCAFKRYMDTKHPLQPERFARVLLKLPSIRSIDRSIVEDLFFVPLIGTVRVADIMDNIVSQTKEF